ncbi:MAG: TIGR01777 family oxidoreductase [Planctomycetota bacterium]
MNSYVASTSLPTDPAGAFAYHERPGALDRLIPPWKRVRVESSDGSLRSGSRVVLRMGVGPISMKWVALHKDYDPPSLFSDEQESGPFAEWLHEHRFETDQPDSSHCVLQDHISYRLPLAPLGQWLGGSAARKELETMFAFRHRITRDDLSLAEQYPVKPMTIAVSGSSGLVGRRLTSLLTLLGHRVIRMERSIEKALPDGSAIAPWASESEADKLSGVDAVVHLAGKSIADSRWTPEIKREIRASRVDLTRQLSETLAKLKQKPSVFICASAIGIYGSRGDEELTESSPEGDDFLADVAIEWEQACRPAREAGIRVANARLGIVLDPTAGALKKMLFPARMMGGRVGHGRQWWSWIAADDVIGAIYHAICNDRVSGPFNVTAPTPVTSGEFAKTLGRVLRRPALFPAPAIALRFALGEMADALLLASTRVLPGVLEETGYRFRFHDLESQLRYCLGRDRLESVS